MKRPPQRRGPSLMEAGLRLLRWAGLGCLLILAHLSAGSGSLGPATHSSTTASTSTGSSDTASTRHHQQQQQQGTSQHLRFEFQRYDGWYNNLANSDWGTPNSRLRRRVPAAYSDGVYQMNEEGRPSARLLSQRMMRGEDGVASVRSLTTLFAFFGQVISSEILMASESGCPIEMHRIKIDKCDPMYDRDCRGTRTMPFYRAAYDPSTGQSPNLPREQVNKVTSWIDGSFIYSTSETWLNTMRSFDGRGTLKMVALASSADPSSGSADTTAASSSTTDQLARSLLVQQEQATMSLFGYPMRNKQRAPLINQMPAHHLKMKTAERMFLLGDPRTNQNPVILAFGILFYRWHNVLAERIHSQHPDWSDEEIFQRARRLVIASLQNVILYEYLPTLLDTPSPYSPSSNTTTSSSSSSTFNRNNKQSSPAAASEQLDTVTPYTGYKPDLHPGVSHVFQSAAFRFGHTMIPPGLYLRDDRCNFLSTPSGFKGVRLCSTWWNAEEVISKVGVEQLLMGAASQVAEREDFVLCNDVRDKLFGPLDFSRRDLAALNIMRGRDNGLPDYNTVRQAFHLARIHQWQHINPQLQKLYPAMFSDLAQLYKERLDQVDLYIGGMLESDLERGRPGELFRRIIKEQFERLRDSDRFWFENLESGIFTAAEVEEIRSIKLYDIIVNSTLIPDHAIQKDVFQFKSGDPCPQPGQLSSAHLQPCYIVKAHSYFKGSELTYLLVCITLILVPVISVITANLVISYQEKRRHQFKTQQEYQRNIQASRSAHPPAGPPTKSKAGKEEEDEDNNYRNLSAGDSPASSTKSDKGDKFYAKEWLHSNLKRKIKVRFGPAPDETIYVLDRNHKVQRVIQLGQVSTIVVELSSDFAKTFPVPLQASVQHGGNIWSTHESSETAGRVLLAGEEELSHKPMVLIRCARNYDLVLQLRDAQERKKFLEKLDMYLRSVKKSMSLFQVPRNEMLANAETKEKRQQRLELFFREAYELTFKLQKQGGAGTQGSGSGHQSGSVQPESSSGRLSPDVSLVMRTSLSRAEFAEALGMRADSLFVKQMFNCVDKDGNGRISFQEFLDTVVMFSRGKPDDRLRIIFDMCDHSRRGVIEKTELVRMLRSLVDIARTKAVSEEGLVNMIHEMFKACGLQDKQLLTYQDFKLVISSSPSLEQAAAGGPQDTQRPAQQDSYRTLTNLGDQQQILAIGLDMKGAKKNFFLDTGALSGQEGRPASNRKLTLVDNGEAQKRQMARIQAPRRKERRPESMFKALSERWRALITGLEEHRQDIVYLFLFFTTVVVLFFERFIMYSFLSEHMDLRHVMGFGIAITRGSAASLSFCYAVLLLSMCRNLMTWIRTMGVREYIPLDSHVSFHKITAYTALVMTVLHTVGHCVNFFHVTQQPVEHLRCLTKEMQFSGESRPTFFYWIFQTVTGTTGLMLWCLCSVMYAFARQRVRDRAFAFFWSTHKLYYLIYALTLLHGSSKLTGSPRFWIFFIIPATLFTIDKIMSLQTKLLQLDIYETECLPSDVISIKFARPASFKFLSGQWIRVACTAFRQHEFHPFTLTSAPQDDFLSIHVRAQGPWTWKLRSLFDPANLQYSKLLAAGRMDPPKLRIEGPFGGGNQDWYKYEVAVMIGGGIGVTPYASILNDLVFGTSTSKYSGVAYKKVYFIWICPTHRNFEWFIDVLKDVEQKDVTNVLEMHIFITQFFHKFDLRTTMLYICENHFQRISNRSLFTGLKAINHFGRPDIAAFLEFVQSRHSRVNKVGVFSCGPKAMTKSITDACEKVNKRRNSPFFLHQYENFS